MQDGQKAVWSISYVSVAFFPSLKHNFITYRSPKVSSRPDCIFEIHQPWQLGFSRVFSNSWCSCSFEPEIIKIDQSFHKMYSIRYNVLNFKESTTILNTWTKKSGNLLNAPLIFFFFLNIYIMLVVWAQIFSVYEIKCLGEKVLPPDHLHQFLRWYDELIESVKFHINFSKNLFDFSKGFSRLQVEYIWEAEYGIFDSSDFKKSGTFVNFNGGHVVLTCARKKKEFVWV